MLIVAHGDHMDLESKPALSLSLSLLSLHTMCHTLIHAYVHMNIHT